MTVTSTSTEGSTEGSTSIDSLVASTRRIRAAVDAVVEGKPEVTRMALVVLLAEGHLLIEDVPGVGKTMLSKSLARAVGGSVSRIQFTPDLLPSDITGVSVYNQETREFEFRPGGVFAHVVVGDEINRASPKTQSAMLECMAERQVSVDGTTYALESPFLVVATQNPVEMDGTYALPEAQRDRFMARVSMGYPVKGAEIAMLAAHAGGATPYDRMRAVSDPAEVRAMIATASGVHVSAAVQRYAVDIADATRNTTALRLGASPRATLHLVRAAKASAAMEGRDYVLPDDLLALAPAVLGHRLVPSAETLAGGRGAAAVLAEILDRVPLQAG